MIRRGRTLTALLALVVTMLAPPEPGWADAGPTLAPVPKHAEVDPSTALLEFAPGADRSIHGAALARLGRDGADGSCATCSPERAVSSRSTRTSFAERSMSRTIPCIRSRRSTSTCSGSTAPGTSPVVRQWAARSSPSSTAV